MSEFEVVVLHNAIIAMCHADILHTQRAVAFVHIFMFGVFSQLNHESRHIFASTN